MLQVKDKKPAKKKYNRGVKRSHSSSSKSKSRPKKIAKISHSDVSRKKDSSSLSKKQSHRSHSHNLTTSSTRHHGSQVYYVTPKKFSKNKEILLKNNLVNSPIKSNENISIQIKDLYISFVSQGP